MTAKTPLQKKLANRTAHMFARADRLNLHGHAERARRLGLAAVALSEGPRRLRKLERPRVRRVRLSLGVA